MFNNQMVDIYKYVLFKVEISIAHNISSSELLNQQYIKINIGGEISIIVVGKEIKTKRDIHLISFTFINKVNDVCIEPCIHPYG